MELSDPSNIIQGNARVVNSRLSDAEFFFSSDCKQTLASRLPQLQQVVFHNKLGSQGERVSRLKFLSGEIAKQLGVEQTLIKQAERAAELCKADLLSLMVGEFPELQGTMGRYYALQDGEDAEVANAIAQHYQPRFNGDALPQGSLANILALADKLDSLCGFFSIGEKPSGERDPFALRRAALGLIRILLNTPLDILSLIHTALSGYQQFSSSPHIEQEVYNFVLERLRNLLREQGFNAQMIDALLILRPTRIDDLIARMQAVQHFSDLPEAQALAAANKRIVNLLKKSHSNRDINPDKFVLEAENQLHHQMRTVAAQAREYLQQGQFSQSLCTLAALRQPVDTFFDQVMVMCEQEDLRANRIALLRELASQMNQIADISRLSV